MWSSRLLETNWIFRFLFPPLPTESDTLVTGTFGTTVSFAEKQKTSILSWTLYCLFLYRDPLGSPDSQVAGALSDVVCSDLAEEAELGD